MLVVLTPHVSPPPPLFVFRFLVFFIMHSSEYLLKRRSFSPVNGHTHSILLLFQGFANFMKPIQTLGEEPSYLMGSLLLKGTMDNRKHIANYKD